MWNPFRHESEPVISDSVLPSIEAQLAALDAEEARWVGFIEGTSIETSVILDGLRGVSERRAALQQPDTQSSTQL